MKSFSQNTKNTAQLYQARSQMGGDGAIAPSPIPNVVPNIFRLIKL